MGWLRRTEEEKELLRELRYQIETIEYKIRDWEGFINTDLPGEWIKRKGMPKTVVENLVRLYELINDYNERREKCKDFLESKVEYNLYVMAQFRRCEKDFNFGIGRFDEFVYKHTLKPILMNELDYTNIVEEIRNEEGRDLKAPDMLISDTGHIKKGISLGKFLDSDAFYTVIKELQKLQGDMYVMKLRDEREALMKFIKKMK